MKKAETKHLTSALENDRNGNIGINCNGEQLGRTIGSGASSSGSVILIPVILTVGQDVNYVLASLSYVREGDQMKRQTFMRTRKFKTTYI